MNREQFERLFADLVMNATEDILVAAEERGLSITDLARRLGISRSNMRRQLSGERNMTLRTLAKLSQSVGLRPRVVFEHEPPTATRTA